MKDPTKRFSDRVADYVKYRPHYPSAMIRLLEERIGLRKGWTIADIGSGTGISSERFLELGCEVTGVEPNREMREAAEALFSGRPNFRSLEGRAEATLLPTDSVDLYVSGQAFHWFDRSAARVEALRILREPKRALVMWNDWRAGDSPFLRDYDAFLNARMPERAVADHRNLGAVDMDAFFGTGRWEEKRLRNAQVVDFEGLKGRLLSASYAPKEGDPGYGETMVELESIFEEHARDGSLDFGYTTVLYLGELGR
jgi:SAM-dependent methyltransferase